MQAIDANIARCRLFLSLTAVFCIYVDPGTPFIAHWVPLISGAFLIDPNLRLLMAVHLTYSAIVYLGIHREWPLPQRLASQPMWVDLLFATAIATLTQGVTSPSYPFFAFAAMAGGLRAGLRRAMIIAAASVGLYVLLLAIQKHAGPEVYTMRLVYLGITGYVLCSLGQQFLDLQKHTRQLDAAEERLRIARELHDGCVQALAGIDLRLESSRRLLQTNAVDRALTQLTDLQEGVRLEYDALRKFARSLAGMEDTPPVREEDSATNLQVRVEVSGSVDLMDQVLAIVREGILNVRRHARATTANINIRANESEVLIDIEDDGVGFEGTETPWSITSRVRETGGQIRIVTDERKGAHLLITLPQV